MKEKYEKSILTITHFSEKDVITTSDQNNVFKMLSELFDGGGRTPMQNR